MNATNINAALNQLGRIAELEAKLVEEQRYHELGRANLHSKLVETEAKLAEAERAADKFAEMALNMEGNCKLLEVKLAEAEKMRDQHLINLHTEATSHHEALMKLAIVIKALEQVVTFLTIDYYPAAAQINAQNALAKIKAR